MIELAATGTSTTSFLPKVIHILTQWYVLYPLFALFLWWLFFKKGKQKNPFGGCTGVFVIWICLASVFTCLGLLLY